jgi:hypothetical protein
MTSDGDLKRCYHEASKIIGAHCEPFSVIENVEKHRNYWRPHKVRILLLGESHVYTSSADSISMQYRDYIEPSNTPEIFARFVYCLGYGESDFVGNKIYKNNGTPQYWKVFASCISNPNNPEAFAPLLKTHNPHFISRINSKIRLLKRMRDSGVWLMDSSLLALYKPGGEKPNHHKRDKVIRVCWDRYIKHQIGRAKPDKIIIIGKNVGRALNGRIQEVSSGQHMILSQPQARMSTNEIKKTYESYYKECCLK